MLAVVRPLRGFPPFLFFGVDSPIVRIGVSMVLMTPNVCYFFRALRGSYSWRYEPVKERKKRKRPQLAHKVFYESFVFPRQCTSNHKRKENSCQVLVCF